MREKHITTSKRLVHNTFYNVVTLVSRAIIGFFLIRFFLGQLGEEKYGVWLLIGGLIFRYGGLLSMGLNSAVNRYIPVYLVEKNEDGIQRVINSVLFFYSGIAIVLLAVSLVMYYNIGSWFVIKPELVPSARLLVLIVGTCCVFATPLHLSSAVLSGLQRYDIINLAVLITSVLRAILLVILLLRGHGLITMGLAFGISEVVARLVQFIFARQLLPQVSLSLASIDFGLLREMLAYGINTFLYAVGAIIIYKASDVVIGIFLGTAEISQFAIAVAAVLLLSQFVQAFTAAIFPAVSELDARNDETRVKQIAFLTQKYSLLLIIPAGCFLVVMGRDFLCVWIGDKFQDPAVINQMGVILAILAVGHCLRLAQHSNFLVLVGRGRHRIFGILTILTALLCVLGSIISLKLFNCGLLGIAWSNCLPMILISGLILPLYYNRQMSISVPEIIRNVWWPALLGSLPAIVMITMWKYFYPPSDWLSILLVVTLAGLLTALSSWFLTISKIERDRFLKILFPGRASP